MLTTADLVHAVSAMQARIAPIAEQLDAADRHLGDGDTGMTMSLIVAAWSASAATLPNDVGAALLALGQATGRATGSSLGAVLAMGLSAAGRSVRGKLELAPGDSLAALQAATATISARSGASAGDKSILDSLLRIEQAMSAPASDIHGVDLPARAAADALEDFRARECRLGRARMYGKQSIGRDDPGMLAAALLLRAATADDAV